MPPVEGHVELRTGALKLTHRKDTCCQGKPGGLKLSVEVAPEEGAHWEAVMCDARVTFGRLSALWELYRACSECFLRSRR